jgi:dTDP-D-glucose 4,6-dehydratase
MSIEAAQRTIGYEPSTDLEQGLRETWEWYLANTDEYKNKQNYFTEKTTE